MVTSSCTASACWIDMKTLRVANHLLDGTADSVTNGEIGEVRGAQRARPEAEVHPASDERTITAAVWASQDRRMASLRHCKWLRMWMLHYSHQTCVLPCALLCQRRHAPAIVNGDNPAAHKSSLWESCCWIFHKAVRQSTELDPGIQIGCQRHEGTLAHGLDVPQYLQCAAAVSHCRGNRRHDKQLVCDQLGSGLQENK